MFLYILFLIFFTHLVNTLEATTDTLNGDKNSPCKHSLTSNPASKLSNSEEVKAIVYEFKQSRNYYRIREYSFLEKNLAVHLVRALNGDIALASKMLSIQFSKLYFWVVSHERKSGERIRNGKVSKEEKFYAVWLVSEYEGNAKAVSRELDIDLKTLNDWVDEHYAINRVKELSGNVMQASRELNIGYQTLRRLVIAYEEEHRVKIRNGQTPRVYTDHQKSNAILKVVELGGNVSGAAKELDIPINTLRQWVTSYEEKKDVQIRNSLLSFSKEDKALAVSKVKENGGNVRSVARELNVESTVLRNWVIAHEEATGERVRNVQIQNSYTDEEKEDAVKLVIELGNNISRASRESGINYATLRNWVIAYEKQNGVKIRNTPTHPVYTDEYKANAVKRVIELGGNMLAVAKELSVSHSAIYEWVLKYEQENDVQIRNTRVRTHPVYTDEYKANVVKRVIEHGGNMLAVAKELNISNSTIYEWVLKYEQENNVVIRNPRVRKRKSS